jgi:hypothetical protein
LDYVLYTFLFLGAHAKFGNPTTTLSGRIVMAVEKREKKKKKRKISTDADGGPRSHVRTAGHSAQPPINVSRNFSAHMSAE